MFSKPGNYTLQAGKKGQAKSCKSDEHILSFRKEKILTTAVALEMELADPEGNMAHVMRELFPLDINFNKWT